MNGMLTASEGMGRDLEIRQLPLAERVKARRANLALQLSNLDALIASLEKNPGVVEVVDMLAKAGF